MSFHIKFLLFQFLLLLSTTLFGQSQNERDSLIHLLTTAEDKERLVILAELTRYQKGDHVQQAIKYGNEAKKLVSKNTETELIQQIGMNLADAFIDLDMADSVKAQAIFLETWGRRKNDAKTLLADGALLKGRSYKMQNEYEESLTPLIRSQSLYLEIGDSSRTRESLDNIGIVYYKLEKFEEFLSASKQQLEYTKKDNHLMMHAAYSRIGAAHSFLFQRETSLEYYLSALAELEKIEPKTEKSQKYKATVLGNISNIYTSLDRYKEAIPYAKRSLELAKETEKNSTIFKGLANLGLLHAKYGNNEEGLEYFLQALSFYNEKPKEVVKEFDLSEVLRGIALQYQSLGKLDLALDYINQTEKVVQKGNSELQAMKCKMVKGIILSDLERYQEAKTLLLSAQKYFRSSEDKFTVTMMHYLGKLYFKENKARTALLYFDSALVLIEKKGIARDKLKIMEDRSIAYESMAVFDSALYAYKSYKKMQDSLFTSESTSVIAELQQQYKTKEQKQKIELLEASQKNERLIRIGLIGGVALLVAIALLIYFLLSNRVKAKNAALKQEQKLDEMKSDFFLNIAHELRTPLTLIQGPLNEIYQDEQLSENHKKSFGRIRKNSEKLVTMAEEILQVSKMESEKIEISRTSIPFKQVVNDIYGAFESEAKKKSIAYSLNDLIDEDFWFSVDKVKFEKILDVLLSNALKYSPEGSSVSLGISENTSNNSLRFMIEDTGIGIKQEDLSHIFDRYFQSGEVSKLKLGGVGIGLSLAKQMALALDGNIEVESELGKGTKFIVTLPKLVDKSRSEHKLKAVQQRSTEHLVSPNETSNTNANLQKILIVDDEPELLDYINEILSEKYQVITASNGKKALDQLSIHSDIALIITDGMMPEMDGFELLRAIKSSDRWNALPVIMLTAIAEDKHRIQALAIGISDYMTKPFNSDALKKQCAHHLAIAAKIKNQSSNQNGSLDLKKIESVIKVYLSEPDIEVSNIASELDINQETLLANLSNFTGLSFQEYIEEVRIQTVRMQVNEKNYFSLDDLSEIYGYKNREHMEKHFLTRFGEVLA